MSRSRDRGPRPETWISIDTEASAPSPGVGSLLSIGASVVGDPDQHCYVELRPVPGMRWDPGAEAVHKLSREYLAANALDPHEAMTRLARWIEQIPSVMRGERPVMVGFNATFDWMFICDYFWRFYGSCPLGISGFDTKAAYFGLTYPKASSWAETTKGVIHARNPGITSGPHTHNALDDAIEQGELLFELLKRKRAGTLK